MAQEKTVNKVKVQLYTPTRIWTGDVCCPNRWRLLDVLNAVNSEEFLAVSGAYINKANILFVREIEDSKTRGLGGQPGHQPYPFVVKSSKAVTLYMPFYTLIGQLHCAEGKSVRDVLGSELRFLPLTNVEIFPSAGGSESGGSFIAVNKGQILSLEEVDG